MRVVDWLVRTTVLVLSALATLALIGSLASVSNTPLGEAFPGRVAPAPAPEIADVTPETTPAPTVSPNAGDAPPAPATATEVRQAIEAAAQGGSAEIARWLKALTYAVLALAVFAAAALVALMRVAFHLGRIAQGPQR